MGTATEADRPVEAPRGRASSVSLDWSPCPITATWSYGPELDPDGTVAPLLIMVHGFRGDHHGLEQIVARLDPSLSVLSPDLPGFGETPALVGKPHDLAAYGEWLRLLVTRAAGDRPVVLVGHSFGSIIAAATVADGLEINQLILINPIGAPALSGPRGILSRLAVLYYWFGARLPRVIGRPLLRSRLITRGLSMIMTKTQDRELRRWIHDQHDRYFGAYANEHVVLESFTASVSHDVSQSAGHITVPTLLIAGADDDITDLRAQRRLCKLFVEAELMELPDVGHLIHYEAPGRAASAINRLALSLVIPRS